LFLQHPSSPADSEVVFLTPYQPGGTLAHSPARSARTTLRLAAAVASGLEAVLGSGARAHANVDLQNVLLDARGVPILAGFGLTRGARLAAKSTLDEAADVRVLAGLIFELITGERWHRSRTDVPEIPGYPPHVASLLRSVLLAGSGNRPDLVFLRYELAVARGLLPKCEPALPATPLPQSKSLQLLSSDLNSLRDAPALQRPVEQHKQSQPPGFPTLQQQQQQSRRIPNTGSAPQMSSTLAPSLAPVTRGILSVPAPIPTQQEPVSEQSATLTRVTDTSLEVPDPTDIAWLVADTSANQDAQPAIFKLLFKRPIGKKPVVALKTLGMILAMLRGGPSDFSVLTVANDGFLAWIEGEWSKDPITSRNIRREHAPYFAAGEIGTMAKLVRTRAAFHREFAKAFAPDWSKLPSAPAVLTTRHREAIHPILALLSLVINLSDIFCCKQDPVAEVRAFFVPALMEELASVFTAATLVQEYMATQDDRSSAKIAIEAARSRSLAAIAAVGASDCSLRLSDSERSRVLRDAIAAVSGEVPADDSLRENSDDERKARKEERRKRNQEKRERRERRERKKDAHQAAECRAGANDSPVANGGGPHADAQEVADEEIDVAAVETRLRELEVRGDAAPHDGSLPPISSKRKKSKNPSKSNEKRNENDSDVVGDEMEDDCNGNGAGGEDDSVDDDVDVAASSSKQSKKKPKPKTSKKKSGKKSSSSTRTTANGDTALTESSSDSDSVSSSSSSSSSDEADSSARRIRGRKSKVSPAADTSDRRDKELTAKPTRRPSPPTVVHTGVPVRVGATGDKHTTVVGSTTALAAAAKGLKTPRMDSRYEIMPHEVRFGQQIGSGGFGVVFKGQFRGQTVAIKKIHANALNNPASIAEFQSEVAVMCTLRHENILQLLGACVKSPNLMIVTEFMARGTLFDVLHQSQMKVTWPMRRKMALDTCRGMRYLHASQILHRDLKSSNLMLDDKFNCKIGDFGLARISSPQSALASQMTGQCGTFQYLCPESIANKPYTEKADIYSFGILLWEIVARKLPYFGMAPMQVGIAVLNQGLRPPIPEKCPPPLVRLMCACWDTNPDRRPSFEIIQAILEKMPDA
jgi:Protein tyrosine and serine/threonine kinase